MRASAQSTHAGERREREHLVVQLLERRARTQQAQAHADARYVRVHRHVVPAVGEQQHTRSGLAADAGQRDEVVARLLERHVCEPAQRPEPPIARDRRGVERELAGRRVSRRRPTRIAGDRPQDRLDARRLHLGDAAGADRLLDLRERRVAHRLP
jgi:hypothetical protein